MNSQYENENLYDEVAETGSNKTAIRSIFDVSTGQFKTSKSVNVCDTDLTTEVSKKLSTIEECKEDHIYCEISIREDSGSRRTEEEGFWKLYVKTPVMNAENFLTSKLTYFNKYNRFFKLFLFIELSFVCLLIAMVILFVNTYLYSVIPVILYCLFLFLLILSRFIKNIRYIKPIYVLLFYLTVFFICKSTLEFFYDYYISSNCKIYLYFIVSINLLYTIIKFIIVYRKWNKIIYALMILYFVALVLLSILIKSQKAAGVGIIYCYFLFVISSYKINVNNRFEKALEWLYFSVLNIGFGIIVSCLSGIYVFKMSSINNVSGCFNF